MAELGIESIERESGNKKKSWLVKLEYSILERKKAWKHVKKHDN